MAKSNIASNDPALNRAENPVLESLASLFKRIPSPVERVFVVFQWLVMGYTAVSVLLVQPVTGAAILLLALAHLGLYALALPRYTSSRSRGVGEGQGVRVRIILSLGDMLAATGIYYLSGHLNGPAHPIVYFVIGAAAARFGLPVALAVMGVSWVLFQALPIVIERIAPTVMALSNTAILYLAATCITRYIARVEAEKAQLHRQTREQVRDLNAVHDTALAITGQLDLPQALRAIAERAAELSSAQSSGIYLLDAERRELALAVCYGLERDYTGLRLKLGEGLVGRVAASGQPLTVEDWRHWGDRPAALAAEQHTAAAGVPLEWQGQVIGVLVVADNAAGRAFTPEDLRRLIMLAPQAATAIVNARHYEQARERLVQVEALQQVTQAIHSPLHLHEVFTQIVTQLHSSFGYPRVGLYLLKGNELICEACLGFDPAYDLTRLPVTQGVIGRVARTGQPALVSDTAQDPDFIRTQEGITTEIAVPLLRTADGEAGANVIGVLNVESGPERPLTHKDLELLMTFAQQVSIAVDHARLDAQVRDQVRDLNAVRETLLDITAQLDLPETLHAIAERARALVSAQGSAIYLLDAERHDLELVANTGLERDYRGRRLALGEGLAGKVAASGQPLIVDNYQTWEGRAEAYAGEPITAVAGVPLEWQGQVIGVLNVLDDVERRAFTQADIQRLMLLAPQAAIAITNARLFEETRRHLADLNAVRQTLLDITAQLDLSQTLAAIAERAVQLVAARGCLIYLLDREAGELVVVADHNPDRQRDYKGTRIKVGEGLSGQVVLRGEPMAVENYSAWEGRSHMYDGEPTGAVAAVPLEWQGEVIGVLNVRNNLGGRSFSQDDIRRLMLLAPQAAIAIMNARLFEQLRQAAEDLERKVEARTRELAEANERLREADRLKTQFLANMSHELRTPMNSIIGYSELMLEETYGELTARQRDRLQTILRNARNLLDLINDLLDISRIEMGKVTLMRRTVHLNRVVETALKTLEPMARQKGLWLQTVLDEGLPPVQADEARLIQILNNLLSNAIKFTREGGVTVTVYPYTDAGDWVAVSVSDTGIGIAPEHLPLIFEEFRQIDPSATREFGGTGLGLAIVRRLVELHGGRVWVESTLGQGSTFTFILPTVESRRRPELSSAALQALAQKLEPGKRLVLVIDDDPAIEELMRAYLDGQDAYQMLAVRDGEEGIMLAQELQPQAILLDVLLAGKDGWEVLAELKGDPRTAAIPVIILSVIDERGLGLRLGATDYLVKPVRRADVLASLARVQEHRPMASELIADA
jgi:signal transduction histidine kinase/CheY-like chemotaxis protein